jgi:hypothetical protein
VRHQNHQRNGERRKRELPTKEWKERALREVWHDYTRRCRLRGYVFELTFEEFKLLITRHCTYCGAAPCNIKRKKKWGNRRLYYSGIDRKDNSKGYTSDNSVPCCHKCNQVKTNVLSFEEMRIAMAAVLKDRAKKARAMAQED